MNMAGELYDGVRFYGWKTSGKTGVSLIHVWVRDMYTIRNGGDA